MSSNDQSLKVKKDAAVSALFSLSRASNEATNALIDLINHLESSGTGTADFRAAFAAFGLPLIPNANAVALADQIKPAEAEPTPRRRRAPVKPTSQDAAKTGDDASESTPAKSPRVVRRRKAADPSPGDDSVAEAAGDASESQIQPVVVPRSISQIQEPSDPAASLDPAAESEETEDSKKPAKRKTRTRAPKDPNAPKRPLSAFLKFRNQVISDLAADNKARGLPGASLEEINTAVAQRWDSLPESERERRKEEFAQLNLAFCKERDLYNAKQKAEAESAANSQATGEDAESSQPSEFSQSTQTESLSQATQADDAEAPPRKRHRKEKSKSKEKSKPKEKEE